MIVRSCLPARCLYVVFYICYNYFEQYDGKAIGEAREGEALYNYYDENLNSTKLYQIYQTKYPRIEKYLDEEINFVKKDLHGNEVILEIGAGYGRIIKALAPFAVKIDGIDISLQTVELGREYLKECPNCSMQVMDAYNLKFAEKFDVVLCMQNGLSAIKGQPSQLIDQCMRVLKPGGIVYFSTYSNKFWNYRLDWFREQAEKGLIGEIDMEKTKNGIIQCKDGFTAITFSEDELRNLGEESGFKYQIYEVDESSLFLILKK